MLLHPMDFPGASFSASRAGRNIWHALDAVSRDELRASPAVVGATYIALFELRGMDGLRLCARALLLLANRVLACLLALSRT